MTTDGQRPAAHLARLAAALGGLDLARIEDWGRRLARLSAGGHRLLVAGNGGSAAQAQHLSAELVGRFESDRMPLSALALHADSSTVTAVSNDFGFDQVFARQVLAHARPGDVLLTLSTSGRSTNLLRAVEVARWLGVATWALTGPAPNPLASLVDEVVDVPAGSASTAQECHLVAIHLICIAIEDALPATASPVSRPGRAPDARLLITGAGRAPLGQPAGSSVADLGLTVTRRTDARLAVKRGGPVKLVVVGDAFLDRDHDGRVERVASDEPALVVSGGATRLRPGGAALSSVLSACAGHSVTLVTAIGQDAVGDRLRSLLGEANVNVVDLGLAGPTAVKTRIRAAGRTLLMLDEQDACPPIGQDVASALPRAREALAAADGILVSDYGRGVAAHIEVREAVAEAAASRPLVWDPHPRGAPPVFGTSIVTPNSREARLIGSVIGGESLPDVVEAARAVLRAWGTQVAVTRGADGALLLADLDSPPLVVPATVVAGPDADPCGAGDRFAGHLAAALAGGDVPSEAVPTAVHAASRHVAGGVGGWLDAPGGPDGSGNSPQNAVELARAVRARGGTVVATGGCFDLLHIGHVRLLEQARQLGDCLIVCLNSDDSARRLKGASRPVVPAEQRAAILASLASVDAVLVFGEGTPQAAIRALRPHVWVKGGDYSMMELPEADLVSSLGGQTVLVPYVDGWSTTSLIDTLRAVR
jgi:rfaE bifunctional protein nucleotidyltransferase chain/domain